MAFGVPQKCGTGGSVITLFLLSVYVCGVHVQVYVYLSVGICMHLCVETRSDIGSLCHSPSIY